MKTNLITCLTAIAMAVTACNPDRSKIEADGSTATMASETGEDAPLAADVLYATKPLISGDVYKTASFQAASLAHFDTAQLIQVLDTTNNMFVKARIQRDTAEYTGFVSKAILPE